MASIRRFLLCTLTAALTVNAAVAATPSAPSAHAAKNQRRLAQEEVRASALNAALNAEVFYEILLGEIATRTGDPATGFALMLEAARSRHDEPLYQRATDIALQARSGESALAAARAWQQAWPQSREANRYVLQILIALNRVRDTAIPLTQELSLTPAPSQASAFLALPQLYRRVSDKALAASLVEQVLAPYLNQPHTGPAAWTALGRLRLQAEDLPGALQAVQQAERLAPIDDATALLALELLERGHADAAGPVERYFAQPQAHAGLRLAYARLLLGSQRYPEAQAQLQVLTSQTPEQSEAWFLLAAVQLQNNQLPEAEAALEKFTALTSAEAPAEPAAGSKLGKSQTQAYLLHAQIAEKRGQYHQADAWLNRINHPDDVFGAQTQRAALLARQGKLPQARALLRRLPTQTAQEEQLKLQAEVQLLRDAKQHASAYELQARLVALAPDNNELLYDQAMMADKLGRFDEMERLLRQVIERQPDFHHAYNALGYSLAERGVRLAEAKTLIETALSYAPNDPFIIDSLGWIHFRLGEPTEALRLLESAFARRPDAEIAAHLGEVLWTLKQPERARAIWQQGLRQQPDNETLQQTMRRFGVQP